MYRKIGAIPPLKGIKIPYRMMVFDTEAFRGGFVNGVEVQTLRLGVAKFIELAHDLTMRESEYLQFDRVEMLYQFIDSCSRKDKTLYIYAHNIKYDLQLSGLLTTMLEDGWKSGLMVISDPPTFIKVKRNRSSVMFVDTFNYWQFSLARMGEQLGLSKLAMPDEGENNGAWFTYCKRDVDVLSEYILEFIHYLDDNDLAPLGLTVASQAFRAYRYRFMTHEIVLHSDENPTRLEREGYSGGRVEAFRIGQCEVQNYYKLDVNSMYPYVMKNELYPYRLAGYTENLSIEQLKRLLDNYYLIAEVRVNSNECFYPLKYQHKLIFPAGTTQTVLHSPEIAYALAHVEILEIYRIALYDLADLFSGYVDFFYGMKLQAELDGNPLRRAQAKLFLNSLYGKFGQREIITKIVENTGEAEYKRLTGYSQSLGCNVEVNYIGSQIQLSYHGGESTYSFPAIAGAVTAYARMYLYKLMKIAGLENVYYIDTDSIICNQTGYNRLSSLLDDKELGLLKLEGTASQLIINGAKDYKFGEDVKHKGLPKSAIQIAPNSWEYEQFRGAKTWINQGLPTGVEVYKRIKQRKTPYNKGIIQPDGAVTPILFEGR